MSEQVLLFDFGSTYTKVMAVNLSAEKVIGWAQSPSTVGSDISIGAELALSKLAGDFDIDASAIKTRLACSSAAGGLRIVSLGLVRQLTAEATRKAALGAGGKLVGSFAQTLSNAELQEIVEMQPDIILLAGGTDGGNEKVILRNASLIAQTELQVPIIIAGNKSVQGDVAEILNVSGKETHVTENVMPELGILNIEPAREIIREIFVKKIVMAKGLAKAEALVGNILMPTPLAVSDGAYLLANGTADEAGLGELIVVDIGGATTDVHSMAEDCLHGARVARKGLSEAFRQRTVEGDMGMRISADSVLKTLEQNEVMTEEMAHYVNRLTHDTTSLPSIEQEQEIETVLARTATSVASERHAGKLTLHYLPGGETAYTQTGKDLSGVKTLIGTGGIFAHTPNGCDILLAALFDEKHPLSLRPKAPRIFADQRYLLFGAGLLATLAPDVALRIMKRHLTELHCE